MLDKLMKLGLWRERLQNLWARWAIFSYREGDNNYSISITIFGYNPKLLL